MSDCGIPVVVEVSNFPVAGPAALLMADATPNPTTPQVAGHLMAFDGSTWDRVRSGPALGSILVDQGAGSWTVDGTVGLDVASLAALESISVQNFPAIQPVSGAVSVSNFPAFPAVQTVVGAVSVSNFPSFPAVQVVSGTVALDAPSLAALESISVQNFPAVQPVSGSVAVSNFPAFPVVQPVSGTVAVSNLPVTQPVSGSVAVSNFPAFPVTQPVSGTVAVSNLPAVQPINDNGGSLTVDGSVAVSNFPASQPVSGTVSIKDSAGPDLSLFFSTDNEMMVALRTNVFRLESTGTFDAASWTAAHIGSGTAGHTASGEMLVQTLATANSRGKVTSVQKNRQMSGTTQMYVCPVRLNNTGVASNIRRWGMFDANDGFFFQLSGTTFSVVTRKGGVDTAIPFGSWNGPSAFTPADLTNYNQFGLFFGGMTCRFHINGLVAHKFPANSVSSPLTNVLTLPFGFESINSGGLATDQQIYSRGTSFHRVSPSEVTPRYTHISTATTTVCRIGAGTLRSIVFNNVASSGSITIYDNTSASGTVIGVINLSGGSANSPFTLPYGMEFVNGLTIVTTSVNDLTVIFD